MATSWRDGLGRVTIKRATGESRRGDVMLGPEGQVIGVCRAPGWMQIYGPILVTVDPACLGETVAEARQFMATQARYRHRQRHGPRAERNRGSWRERDDDANDELF